MNCLATGSIDTATTPRRALLASMRQNIKAVPALIRNAAKHPAIHEAYLSYGVALGNGDFAEIALRVAMGTVTRTFDRALNRKRERPRAAIPQAA